MRTMLVIHCSHELKLTDKKHDLCLGILALCKCSNTTIHFMAVFPSYEGVGLQMLWSC